MAWIGAHRGWWRIDFEHLKVLKSDAQFLPLLLGHLCDKMLHCFTPPFLLSIGIFKLYFTWRIYQQLQGDRLLDCMHPSCMDLVP